jgi:hypothetical protein
MADLHLQTPYERIPRMWITDETPSRVLFVKGRSGIDPDVLVAFAENDPEHSFWIVDDGCSKYDKASYHVCGKGTSFNARPVMNDPVGSPSHPEVKP